MMDCISIWQKDKDTISEALPDEYKDKSWVEKVIRLDTDQGPQNLTIQAKTVIFSGIRIQLSLTPLAK